MAKNFKTSKVQSGQVSTVASVTGMVLLDTQDEHALAGVTLTFRQAYRLAAQLMFAADTAKQLNKTYRKGFGKWTERKFRHVWLLVKDSGVVSSKMFFSHAEARRFLERHGWEDHFHIEEECSLHKGQPAKGCNECPTGGC